MSMIAMAAPAPHSSFNRDYSWDGPRSMSDYRPRQSERITLPGIRQAFPELSLRIPSPQDPLTRTPSTTTSPTTGPPVTGATPPEYTHSPNSNKRRRFSVEDPTGNERANRVPRLYSAAAPLARQPSPSLPPRTPVSETWGGSAKTSPFLPSGGMQSARSPRTVEIPDRSMERRPTLPSLSLAHGPYEREVSSIPRSRGHSQDDYPTPGPIPHSAGATPLEAPHSAHYQRPNPFSYPYHHPSRLQSLSVGSVHPFDRTPYHAAPVYGHGYHDFVRYGDMAHGGLGGDNKQRKRRGNLPKETTDKLRAWFVAHLHHPYPTEDEKQDLMRQTGLQMNQISNWFINARRRQLPTMINNARAESDALNSSASSPGASGDGKIMPSTERSDYDDKSARTPLSDGEASSFDEMRLKRTRSGHAKRGSI